ncbi:alpha/beta hydrolase [Variovorax defluvii]|uniref:Alpha/beta hydrolase n=1 Tax=Variovorax defluvii TaxID=913761 RepID=A0ABP8HEL4_9BURK
MSRSLLWKLLAPAFVLGLSMVAPAASSAPRAPEPKAELGFIPLDADITLRRMVVRSAKPKGTVILLHGFPETLYAYKGISLELAKDYDVHAFDWPGYGQSSRPAPDRFSYAPNAYARVLQQYIDKAGIDTSRLTIYATDIGALPAMLLALDQPGIARSLIVGDFAPFDRPPYMHENLQALKSKASAAAVNAAMNKNRDEILENAYRRGFAKEEQFDLSPELKRDMREGWDHGGMSSADAFHHYYAHFTQDQVYFEAHLARWRTPVKVVWGEKDFYIKTDMGAELADKLGVKMITLPGLGHYPHLQDPQKTVAEIRASLAGG